MHKNYLSLVLSILIVLLAPSLTCRAEQYLFLVGVQDHANPSNSPSLRYAEQDVHTLADLYTKAGVPSRNILLMTHRAAAFDPNLIPRSDLIRANFEQFLRKLGPEDSINVGLSGHGVQFKGEEFGYFSPIDSSLDPNRRDTLISLKEIYHKLSQSPQWPIGKDGYTRLSLHRTPSGNSMNFTGTASVSQTPLADK